MYGGVVVLICLQLRTPADTPPPWRTTAWISAAVEDPLMKQFFKVDLLPKNFGAGGSSNYSESSFIERKASSTLVRKEAPVLLLTNVYSAWTAWVSRVLTTVDSSATRGRVKTSRDTCTAVLFQTRGWYKTYVDIDAWGSQGCSPAGGGGALHGLWWVVNMSGTLC